MTQPEMGAAPTLNDARREPQLIKRGTLIPEFDDLVKQQSLGLVQDRYPNPGDRSSVLTRSTEERVVTAALLTPVMARTLARFRVLKRWEGVVTETYSTYFEAQVIDLDSGDVAMMEMELADVSAPDVHLCEAGALFYWTIGYEIRESGQQSRASKIHFRRLGSALGNAPGLDER